MGVTIELMGGQNDDVPLEGVSVLAIDRHHFILGKGFLEPPIKFNHNIAPWECKTDLVAPAQCLLNDAKAQFGFACPANGIDQRIDSMSVIVHDLAGELFLLPR
jgi:hypothetical protein